MLATIARSTCDSNDIDCQQKSTKALAQVMVFAAGTCLTSPLGYQTNLMVFELQDQDVSRPMMVRCLFCAYILTGFDWSQSLVEWLLFLWSFQRLPRLWKMVATHLVISRGMVAWFRSGHGWAWVRLASDGSDGGSGLLRLDKSLWDKSRIFAGSHDFLWHFIKFSV